MKIFFDTEFTGLKKDTSLMTIGLIDENGRSIYAEIQDFDRNGLEDFIKDVIIPNTISLGEGNPKNFLIKEFGQTILAKKETVRKEILKWLSVYKEEEIQFVSDVSHYDFVLLIDLLYGHALNTPKNVSAVCHDINQDIAIYYNISDFKAFNVTREDIIKEEMKNIVEMKHNALYDAKIIRLIYNKINKR